ncbi:MAG: type III-A CRISPR-associated protein Cas10/Csm1 [Promethearchaeota archaeon]
MTATENFSKLVPEEYHNDIIYGAFLHDLGKFIWRADKTQPTRYNDLGPEDFGRNGAHAKWSADFFCEHLKGKLFEPTNDEIIEKLILFHHNPESDKLQVNGIDPLDLRKMVKIIQIADHASSGERLRREIEGKEEEHLGDPQTELLRSVFCDIKLKHEFNKDGYYSLNPLNVGKDIDKLEDSRVLFPKPTKQEAFGRYASDTQQAYRRLYSQFIKELTEIINNKGKITFTTLYFLALKYLLNVPSATFVDIPDISLFDHVKSTAAIASCLFQDLIIKASGNIKNIELEDLTNPNEKRYLLIMGNISGIQDFIYSISSKGAAKALKGRSFFLEIMGNIISKFILDQFQLPTCCEIYCDGGNFYLLAPASCTEELEKTIILIQNYLYNVFKGELFVDIDWIAFNRHNFLVTPEEEGQIEFKELWSQINAKVGALKFKRFNKILSQLNGYDLVFKPMGKGGETGKNCSICKEEKELSELDEEKKCNFCQDLEQITRKISKLKYLALINLKPVENKGFKMKTVKDFTLLFNYDIEFLGEDEISKFLAQIKDKINNINQVYIYSINNTSLKEISELLSEISTNGLKINLGFEFVGNIIPVNEKGEIKSFDIIATEPITLGTNKIGILRMDLDNLGLIFSKGLKINSLSRLSTLSLRLKLFFKYWIIEICKGNIIEEDLINPEYYKKINEIHANQYDCIETFKKRITNNFYLLYSSGDDLFLIGHWNDIILISEIIQQVFSRYTLQNPNLTISGGVLVIDSKFPLYQAADLAGDAEEKSKAIENKNSITILGTTYSWDEFRELSLIKEELFEYYKNQGLSKAYIHRLLRFNELYKKVYDFALKCLKSKTPVLIQNKNKINLYYNVDNDPEKTAHEAAFYSGWYWRFAYHNAKMKKYKKALQSYLEQLEQKIVQERKIKDLYLPARWAELLLKGKKIKNK